MDGVPTANLPVYIDTPVSITYTSPANQSGGCPAFGYPNDTGYVTIVTNSVNDLTGMTTLTQIDTHETLENIQHLQPGSNWGTPAAGYWGAGMGWATNTTFFDYLWICGPSTGGIPQQVNYDPSSSTPGLNETQKMWVGFLAPRHFLGGMRRNRRNPAQHLLSHSDPADHARHHALTANSRMCLGKHYLELG